MADLVRFRRPEEGWPGEAVPQNTPPIRVQRPAGGWPGETLSQTVPANPGELRSMAVDYGRGITELVGTPGQQGRSFTNLVPAGAPSTGINEAVRGFRATPQGVQGAAAPTAGVTSPDAPVTATPAVAQPTGFRPALAGQTVFAPAYNAVYGSVAEQRKAFEAAQPKPLDAKTQAEINKLNAETASIRTKPAAAAKLQTFDVKQKTSALGDVIPGVTSVSFGEFGTYDITPEEALFIQDRQNQLYQYHLGKGLTEVDAYNKAVSDAYKIFSTPRT